MLWYSFSRSTRTYGNGLGAVSEPGSDCGQARRAERSSVQDQQEISCRQIYVLQ